METKEQKQVIKSISSKIDELKPLIQKAHKLKLNVKINIFGLIKNLKI